MKTSTYKWVLFFFPLLLGAVTGNSQVSIHQEESQKYKNQNFFDLGNEIKSYRLNTDSCKPEKMVFGYHPYWIGDAWQDYQWNLLTDLCYFSYEVNPASGNPVTLNGWDTNPVIDSALANQTRVHLCITLFSSHSTFFNSATAGDQLIQNTIALLKDRHAHGVNLDFEAVPLSQSAKYNQYLIRFADSLHAAIPGCIVSMASPAVDWDEMLDIQNLSEHLDYLMIMGYDYYWNGSNQAGPVSGMYAMTSSYPYSVSRTLSWYLSKGATVDKILLGLPYYGRDWPVNSIMPPANSTGTSTAITYRMFRNNYLTYSNENLRFEKNSQSPYYLYNVNGWHHCFMDNVSSLGAKYELVRRSGIAGIGIWALGYDDGYEDLWNLIRDKLTDCSKPLCMDTLYDNGGPAFNYFNDEEYQQTISIGPNETIELEFLEFDLQEGHDSLFIYQGTSLADPLIGAFTGNTLPQIPELNGNSITLKFISDGTVTNSGWKAVYRCPTADIAQLLSETGVTVFPNPTYGAFTLKFRSRYEGNARITFHDLQARNLGIEKLIQVEAGSNTIPVWPEVRNDGMYICRLILPGGEIYTFKLIILAGLF
ncbi:MAG: T9SS type A sorting domain-containing protein [Bacteroidales bacterium]|nr:T9SS type A sorting domain-containing protein [Bacteroidales bacterium]